MIEVERRTAQQQRVQAELQERTRLMFNQVGDYVRAELAGALFFFNTEHSLQILSVLYDHNTVCSDAGGLQDAGDDEYCIEG